MEDSRAAPTLKKTLRVSDGVALLIGITIGSGIYATPSIIAGYLPNFWVIISCWIAVGFFVYIGGLIYAELGTRFPNTGGEYVYITRSFGPFAGFVFGWSQLFIIRTSPAAGLAIVAADYLEVFIPLSDLSHRLVAVSIILLLGLFNYIGIKWASIFQQITTWLKVFGLVFFVVVGFFLLREVPSQLDSRAEPIGTLGTTGNMIAALFLIVFSYVGWDRVGYVAGEMKNPRKVIPNSMIFGLGIILLIYWGANALYHYTLDMESIRTTTTPAADVALKMVGTGGSGLIALIAIISAVSSTNGTIMSAPRVYFAMARDGLFFKWLDFIHPVYRTPARAIIAHCIWGIVLLIVRGSFATIVAGMVFAILIFYSMTTLAFFKFRSQSAGEKNCFKMPGYPVLPAVYLMGIVSLVVLRAIFDWKNSLMDIAFVATGIPFAFYWVRKSRKNSE